MTFNNIYKIIASILSLCKPNKLRESEKRTKIMILSKYENATPYNNATLRARNSD